MDDKEKKSLLFPQEFKDLNKEYEDLKNNLAAIDAELDNPIKDRGPNPKLTPSGMDEAIDPNMRSKRIQDQKDKREQVVGEFKAHAKKTLGDINPKASKEIFDVYDYETSRNKFKGQSKEQKQEEKGSVNKEAEIFDYMTATYFDRHLEAKSEVEKGIDKSAAEKENIDVWSDRFIKQLDSYKDEHDAEKATEPGKDLSDPDFDKD